MEYKSLPIDACLGYLKSISMLQGPSTKDSSEATFLPRRPKKLVSQMYLVRYPSYGLLKDKEY